MFTESETKWLREISAGISSEHGQIDKKLRHKGKWLPYCQSMTPWDLCKKILLLIKKEPNFYNKNFVVVDTAEFVLILLRLGVKPCNITYIATYRYLTGLVKSLGVDTKSESFISWSKPIDMKIDVVVGNPPFNIAGDKRDPTNTTGANSGTGGNSRAYRAFREKALQCLAKDGILAFISPKNIIKDLIKDGNQIDIVNLMSDPDYNHWKYNTLYFFERKSPKTSTYALQGGICAKMFGAEEWQYREFNRTEDRVGKGNILAVTQVPKEENLFLGSTGLVKTALPAAPRFAFSLLESKKSYMTSDLPFCASMSACITVGTMNEANKLKLFVENNKGLLFFHKNMKLKGLAKDSFRFMKKFNLSQISSGLEYPVEWNLSKAEIDYIEEAIK